jgi:werner syndrome-like exonuclease
MQLHTLYVVAVAKLMSFATGMPPALAALLQSPSVIKCGVNITGDSHKLHLDYGFHLHGMADLNKENSLRSKYHVDGEHISHTLAELCEALLQRRLPKPGDIRCGNWDAWRLSSEQQLYAARDAYASLLVAEAMQRMPLECTSQASVLPRAPLSTGPSIESREAVAT